MRIPWRALLLACAIPAAGAVAKPGKYDVERVAASDERLLSLDADVWAVAHSIGWGGPQTATTFRALAGRDALFVRFDVADAQPWSTLTRRDARLWTEEVVEIFIGRDDATGYIELQINPANVVADLRIDLERRSFDAAWDFAGLQTRVHPLRDSAGNATGWSAVAKLPWPGFDSGSGAPATGERWRFNVFRIERPGGREQPERDARFLAWSPTGSRSFHVPEAFGELVFR